MPWVNPFAQLTDDAKSILAGLQSKQNQADRDFNLLVEQYRGLLEDSRYTKVKQQIISSLASELRLLVDEAAKVPATAPRAARIKILEQLINDPLEALWLDEQQKNMASDGDNG